MSLNNVQQNTASTMQSLSVQMLQMQSTIVAVVKIYQTESMSSLSDAEYQELPDFEHVTEADMTNAKITLDAIDTLLGDFSGGTNATKLLAIVNTVP